MPTDLLCGTPTPAAIREQRDAAGLSQAEAAALVGLRERFRWSEYERGVHQMSPGNWAIFLLSTGQHPTKKVSDV